MQAQSPISYSQDVQWYWQADLDPWAEREPTKWTWKPYATEHSQLIERSFLHNQGKADLGNYEIYFKEMLQVNKSDRTKIRRVGRVQRVQSRLMMELPEPKSGTFNHAFGNVHDFLKFIYQRRDENFYWRLKLLRKEEAFDDVVCMVIRSIRDAVEAKQKAIQPQRLLGLEKINDILTKMDKARTLEAFLKLVLKAYTIESFLCYWLNELLRNENWVEINVLNVYLICLLYIFTHATYIIPDNTKKVILYRGTALTEQHLKYYHNIKMFSWNAVTSTSRNKNEALKFACSSGDKIGILFVIEANFGFFEDREGIIDVSQDSAYPHEEEVVFAPGSVFEVTGIYLNQNQNQGDPKYKYEVRLAFRKNFEKSDKTFANLQSQVIKNPPPGGYTNPASFYEKKKAVLKNRSPEEIRIILNLLRGDESVKSLSIEECVLDNSLIKLLGDVINTIKLDELTVVNNNITIDSVELLSDLYKTPKLYVIIVENNNITIDRLSDFNSKHREILAQNKVTFIKKYNTIQNLLTYLA